MKVCIKCKQEKVLSDFNFKIKARGTRQAQCNLCTREYIRNHYNNNRSYYLLKATRRNRTIRQEFKHYIWTYLGVHPCVDCGEKDPIVLEFDHIRDKRFTISSSGRNKRLDVIQKEIEKCKVRCANCHRRKTAVQFGWSKKIMPL
jgi:hypothetical protein